MAKQKYYAVKVGREGPKVYASWPECNAAVKGFPRAVFKSFPTYEEARSFAFGAVSSRTLHSSAIAAAATDRPTIAATLEPEATANDTKTPEDREPRWTTTVTAGKAPAKSTKQKRCIIYFDGGSRGNPGHAGVGCVVYDITSGTLQEAWRGYEYIGFKTNNSAEYQGLLLALKYAKLANFTTVDVRGDSQLILEQLRGRYRVMTPSLKPLYNKARRLLDSFTEYSLTHVYREENTIADSMANEAMDKQQSSEFPLEEPEEDPNEDAYTHLVARMEQLAEEQKQLAETGFAHKPFDDFDDEDDELDDTERHRGRKHERHDRQYAFLGRRAREEMEPDDDERPEVEKGLRPLKPRRHH